MQRSTILRTALGAALLSAYGVAQAAPFTSFDPRSMAMGGAGVAVGNAATAPFFNPALLAAVPDDADFALEIPIVGVRLYDPDDFVGALDDFDKSGVMDDMNASVTTFNNNPTEPNVVAIKAPLNALDKQLVNLGDKPLQAEVGAAVVVGIPSKNFGMAFSASATGSAGGVINYSDTPTVAKLTADIDTLDNCYITAAGDQNAFYNCVTAASFNYVDLTGVTPSGGTPKITFETKGANSDIQSTVDIRGIRQYEYGVSIAREFDIGGAPYGIGITPKVVQVTVFDFADNPDAFQNMKAKDYTYDYQTVNMDIGVARDLQNGIRVGLVVKNVVPQSFDTYRKDPVTGKMKKTGNSIDMAPQARAGISRQGQLYTLAADVDLTENDPVGYEGASRFVSLGAEFNAWDWAQLRVGYRANTVDSDRNVWSAGFGLSPFGVHIDAAVSGNDSEVGAALQLGFRF